MHRTPPASNLVLGGIAIAERHVAKEDEHHRMLTKQDHGCRFFITQSVYNADSTKSLLSDYALSLRTSGRSPIPVVLTFSPCGSVRTLEFMKWLGISFPRWLENELRHSADTLEALRQPVLRVFTDVQDYVAKSICQSASTSKTYPFESRKSAHVQVELYRRLSSHLETVRRSSLPNRALQQTGLSVASLPLAPAAERRYVRRQCL